MIINDLPICVDYNDIRRHRLAQVLYPSGVLIRAAVMHDDGVKEEARKKRFRSLCDLILWKVR